MRKILSLLLVIVMLVGAVPMTIQAAESDGFNYEINDGSATITGYYGNDSEVVIPSEIEGYPVKTIGWYAFLGIETITSVTVPESVTTISEYAFSGCTNLQSINLHSGITQFGIDCFAGTGLTGVSIPLGTTEIPYGMFRDCKSLGSVTLPDSITVIGGSAFENCTSLTSIKLPVRVKEGGGNLFKGSGLRSITIYNTIGCYLPEECQSLKSITYYGSEQDWLDSEGLLDSLGISLNCTGSFNYVESEFPAGLELKVVDREVIVTAYNGDKSSIVIPETIYGFPVKVIESMRGYKTHVTSITLPDSVREIGDSALLLTELESVNIPKDLKFIGEEAFRDTNIKSAILPEGLEIIEGAAFNGSEIETLVIPSTVTEISYGITMGCASLKSITVAEGNSRYHSSGNCLIETAEQTVIAGCAVSSIPADGTVRIIADGAFHTVGTIDELFIPRAVITIWSQAFWDTVINTVKYEGSEKEWEKVNYTNFGGLANAEIIFLNLEAPEADPLDYLSYTVENGEVTITGYTGTISDYVIPATIEGCPVTAIGNRAFMGNTLFTSVVVPEGVKTIGQYAFSGCAALEKISLPMSLTSVYSRAFGGCDALTTVEYAGTEDEWDDVGIASGNNPLKNAEVIFGEQEKPEEPEEPEEPEVVIVPGDANGDGVVNSRDTLQLKRYIAGKLTLDSLNFANTDITGDGKINAMDSLRLKRIITGK